MTFPGVSQPESNDYFPPLAKIRIAFDHVFFDLFSIIAFWYARKTRRVFLYNLNEKSADDLNFWWSYCNFCPRPVTNYFPSYLSLRRVPAYRSMYCHSVLTDFEERSTRGTAVYSGVVLRGERVLVQKRGILYLKCNLYTHNDTKLVHKSNFPS